MSLSLIVRAYLRTWAEWYIHMVLVLCRTAKAAWHLVSPASAISIQTATYNEHGQLLVVYKPNGTEPAAIAKRPVLLLVHGGAWTVGIGSRFDFASHCMYLVRQGYTVATVSYRLLPKHPYPAGYEDVRDAVEWVSKTLGKPVMLMGHSAGGHLSLLVGLRNPNLPLAGVVSLSAPTDLTATLPVIEVEKRLFLRGTTGDEASPFHDVASLPKTAIGTLPTFYIFHGDRDIVIPIEQANIFVEALRNAGARVQFHVMEGVGHWFPFVSETNFGVVDTVMEEILATVFPASSPLNLPSTIDSFLLPS